MPEDADQTADAASTAEPEKDAKKRSRKLPLLVGVVVLLAGGAAAAWYVGVLPIPGGIGGGSHAATPATESHGAADAHGGGGADAHAIGGTLALDPFIANLVDEGGKRYLKTTFQVEFLGDSAPPEVNARLPQIRDLVLTLLTSKSFADIRTPEGKQQLREDIITRMNQVFDHDVVKAVYFTEFIVQ